MLSDEEQRQRARRAQAESLDALSASWRSALDAAQDALAAAGPVLGSVDLRERSVRLRSERAEAARALEGLAHDRHAEAWFSDLQAPAASLRRLLGLPPEVASVASSTSTAC